MYQCPIDYFAKNMIFNTNKSIWAAYKLQGFDYDHKDFEYKIGILNKTARFLATTYSELQILIIPMIQDMDEHFKTLNRSIPKNDILRADATNFSEQTKKYLKEQVKLRGDINDYRTYIVVKLSESEEDDVTSSMRDMFQYFIKDPINAVNFYMNLDAKDILTSKVNKASKICNNWFTSANDKIKLVEADDEEMQWLFRRVNFRGIQDGVRLFYSDTKKGVWHPKAMRAMEGKEEVLRPFKRDVINLFTGTISCKNRMLKIEHENRVSYQTFLSVTNLPDEIEFPGKEWIYMLQRLNSQAEICIHIKAIEHKTFLDKLENKSREISSQQEEVRSGKASMPDDLRLGSFYAKAMETELKEYRDPGLVTNISVCLASSNPDILEQKVILVKEEFEDMKFVVERSIADQFKLYMQFIPSVSPLMNDYEMYLTPLTLAGGVIGATRELGDTMGPYIGTTGIEKKNVFLWLGLACLRNKSAAATFYGDLGYGKSFNANLLLFLSVLYGGYGLVFDPKGERGHWETDLPILSAKGLVTVVRIAPTQENKGKLDPYLIYRDNIADANELAINVITECLKISPSSTEYLVLLEATRKMRNNKSITPCMEQLINILNSFSPEEDFAAEARLLAKRIDLQKDNGMFMLLIGNGTEEAISLDNRLNVLQIENLKFPDPNAEKKDYTREEQMSTIMMMIMAHFAKKFALVKRRVYTSILIDESWSLKSSLEGVKMIDWLTRMGRSLFCGVILNGHSVLDLPSKETQNTITYKFCFHTSSEEEAERFCSYLGLDVTGANKATLMNLKNAECMFKDLEGHVGLLKFDAVFEDLIEAFSTTPTTEEEEEDQEKELQEYVETITDKNIELDLDFNRFNRAALEEEIERDLFAREVIDEED